MALLLSATAYAAQYTAFSLKVAQQRIEQAGEGWRQKEPEVVTLAGINRVEGFVQDADTGGLILVGTHEEGRAPLGLDDLVVALRARFRYNPHVVVREGVCVVRGLKVGVFTEVLAAKIDGKAVEDLKGFKLEKADAFANDVSGRFDELCGTQPSFNRLQGLQELVAVSKALQELEERPDLAWWLEKYPLTTVDTPKETKVLRRRYDGQRGWFEVSGGVHLAALAMRLNAGDVKALQEAVLTMRPSAEALTWWFVAAEWVIPLEPGQVKPEDISPLFQQAVFLQDQERHADALPVYDAILQLDPRDAEAWSNKGVALYYLKRYAEARKAFEEAVALGDANARRALEILKEEGH